MIELIFSSKFIRLNIRTLLGVAALCSAPAHSIVIRHDVDDTHYRATKDDFPPLTTLYKIGAHGTLIAPQWVATAAHTIFCVTPGDKLSVNGQLVEVEARYAHHLYERGGEHDLALIKLSQPVDNTAVAHIYPGSDEAGKQIWFIGSGGTGNGNEGQTVSYKQNGGVLRKAQNTIREVDAGEIFFTFNEGEDALPLEGVSGNGDSGGPAFIEQDGQFYLLGVSSRADSWFKEMGEYGVNEVYTRVSQYQDWISNVIIESPDFISQYTSDERFPQPGIEDRLTEICEQIGW